MTEDYRRGMIGTAWAGGRRLGGRRTNMPVPDFQTIMLPYLRTLRDGEQRANVAIRDLLADEFELSDEERNEILPSGRTRRFSNRVAWAGFYLSKAGLIEKPARGQCRITDQGRKVLAEPPDRITIGYLMQFPGCLNSASPSRVVGRKAGRAKRRNPRKRRLSRATRRCARPSPRNSFSR